MLTVWDWLRNSIFQIQQQQIIPQASCWNKKRSFGGYVRRFGNQAHDDLHDLESSKMLLALLETKVWLKSSVGDEWVYIFKDMKYNKLLTKINLHYLKQAGMTWITSNPRHLDHDYQIRIGKCCWLRLRNTQVPIQCSSC